MKKRSRVTARQDGSASVRAVLRKECGELDSPGTTVNGEAVISRRKGGAKMLKPMRPIMQPRAGRFVGNDAAGLPPRVWEAHARMATKVAGAKRMLT